MGIATVNYDIGQWHKSSKAWTFFFFKLVLYILVNYHLNVSALLILMPDINILFYLSSQF